MKRTQWFSDRYKPYRPGVYLTRASYLYKTNDPLTWWRAFDGENWHSGICAVDPAGTERNVAPSYESLAANPVIGSHVELSWCGLTENAS